MKMIKRFFILFAVFFASLLISSCTENDSIADIDLGEIPLEIPIFLERPVFMESTFHITTTASEFQPFSGTKVLRDTALFAGISQFNALPKQFFVKNVRIQLKKDNKLKGSRIKEIRTEAYNNLNNNKISSYEKDDAIDLESDYPSDSVSDPKLTEYVKKIFEALEEKKDVSIAILGLTDIEVEDPNDPIGMINILVDLSVNVELK